MANLEDPNISDYKPLLSNLHQSIHDDRIKSLETLIDRVRQTLTLEREQLIKARRTAMTSSVSRSSGEKMSLAAIHDLEDKEAERWSAMNSAMHALLTAQRQLKKIDDEIDKKQTLADRVTLVDYEQLKYENKELEEEVKKLEVALREAQSKASRNAEELYHLSIAVKHVQSQSDDIHAEFVELVHERDKLKLQLIGRKNIARKLAKSNDSIKQQYKISKDQTLMEDYERTQHEIAKLTKEIEMLRVTCM